jgi:hypothetical protein
MTCPVVIRGAEQWSRWSNLSSRPLLESEGSEGRSRVPERGIRLRPVLGYGFILLALCLLLSDTFRLALTRNSSRDVVTRTQTVRSVRTVHGTAHARLAGTKRHSGV